MDQAENDLHITVMSVELVRRLTNKLFENNYAGHFVNKHTCIQGLSREGKSEKGIQTSCVTSSSLVPYEGVFVSSHSACKVARSPLPLYLSSYSLQILLLF